MKKRKNIFVRNQRKSIFKLKGFKQALSLIMILFMCLVLLPVSPIEAVGEEAFQNYRIYLDTRSMSKNYDFSFNNYDSVRLWSSSNGFRAKSGITEIGGVKYLYWDSLNDDSSFLFTCGVSDKGDDDIWNIVAFNDYTRTDVINVSINAAKGNIFYWDSVSMVKIKASDKTGQPIREQYVLNKKEVYSENLTSINSNYIYLDATDMIETCNWASAGRNNVVLHVSSDGREYAPTGVGKNNDRYYIYWNAQDYNVSEGVIFLYKGKFGDTNDNWTLKNNKEFCRTEYVNGNTEFINDNTNNSGIKGKIFYPIVNANGFDDNKTDEKTNTYTYKLGTRTTFDNTSTISKGDESQDIPTGTFTQDDNLYYVNSTIYDYYSDYELMAGKDRSNISRGENTLSYTDNGQTKYRKDVRYYNTLYMPERIFDLALSDYYKDNSVEKPIYFGHFQSKHSEEGTLYHNIATELNLYGYSSNSNDNSNVTKNNVNNFYNNNNSEWRINCNDCAVDVNHTAEQHETSAAVQGLVNNTLTNNNLTIQGSSGTVEAPYFSESFLRGNNSKGVNLGNVYKNVAFPFKLNSEGYWEFNSADSSQSLRLKQDSSTSQYYMDRVGSDNAVMGFTNDAPTTVSNYFPFNDKEDSGNVAKLNYGFGTRFDIKFTLTEDGQIEVSNSETGATENKNIEFNFSGDDDVWVFIDGKLALDIGGGHGAVSGKINFGGSSTTKTATVSGVKTADGTEYNKTTTFDLTGSNTKEHTLTMFYMERGLWESNMKITFNFPKHNNFEVGKTVDIPKVDPIFNNAMETLKTKSFDFSISNLVTDGHDYTGDGSTPQTTQKIFNAYSDNDTILKTGDVKYGITTKDNQTVISWYAPSEKKDKDGQDVTDKRLVKIYSNSSKDTLDVSSMSDYLTFNVFNESSNDDNGLYPFIALVDGDGTRIGAWITDVYAYDSSNTSIGKNMWRTIKVDLEKLKNEPKNVLDVGTTEEFDFSNVKEIQFAYWNDVNIYITPFIFNKKVEISEGTVNAFETDPTKIKDYGSNSSKKVEPANGAIYSIAGQDGYKEVSNGSFSIKDKETASFRDQFRKGSYILVSEVGVDPNVFKTTWSIYDDGKEISKEDLQKETINVKQTENKESVTEVEGFDSGDGRTVKSAVEGITKPDNSIAFYRYDAPDNENLNLNLKVSYVNQLKVGNLTIKKSIAEGDVTDKDYKFKVTFSNVAGMSLEGNEKLEKEFTLNPSHSKEDSVPNEITISGIPAGTSYKVQEIKGDGDEFTLKEVTQSPSSEDTIIDLPNYTVSGTIVADQDKNLEFGNLVFPSVEVKGEKYWEGNEDEPDKPEEITIRLERKVKGADESTWEVAKDKAGNDIADKVVKISDSWEYGYSGLPKYVDPKDKTKGEYEYRVVEIKVGDKDVADSGYNPEYSTDSAGNLNITNKKVGSITIVKADSETKETITASNTTFKIQKLKDTSKDKDVNDIVNSDFDTSFTKREDSTGANGTIKFDNLPKGTYLITEVEAPSGYIKLNKPFKITLPHEYKAGDKVDGEIAVVAGEKADITIKVLNPKAAILPIAGLKGIQLYLLIGIFTMLLSAGVCTVVNLRKSKKTN